MELKVALRCKSNLTYFLPIDERLEIMQTVPLINIKITSQFILTAVSDVCTIARVNIMNIDGVLRVFDNIYDSIFENNLNLRYSEIL